MQYVYMTLIDVKKNISGEFYRLIAFSTPFIEGSLELTF